MTQAQAGSPPPWAHGLGYAGLLPFVVLAIGTWVADPEHRLAAGFALASYGAVIASFLGAIHWGLVMRDASGQSAALLGWGVVPSLMAWLALMLDPVLALLLITAVLWTCFAVDRLVYPRFQAQTWLPMRLALTLVASASCALGAAGLVCL
jgi:Protein of unknown function (DUF3429)